MARPKPGELERKVCGPKTGAVRLQLFPARKSGDVSDDEPADLWRRDRGGGAAQRRDQAIDGPSGDTPETGHGKIYGLMLLGVVQIVFFPGGGQIPVSRQPRREPAGRDADAACICVGGRFAGRAGGIAGCRA